MRTRWCARKHALFVRSCVQEALAALTARTAGLLDQGAQLLAQSEAACATRAHTRALREALQQHAKAAKAPNK